MPVRYTALQIIIAARDLQDAAGAPEKPIEVSDEQTYTLAQAIAFLSPEIRLLRERGFSDNRIADLLTGFEVEAADRQVAEFYQPDETMQ